MGKNYKAEIIRLAAKRIKADEDGDRCFHCGVPVDVSPEDIMLAGNAIITCNQESCIRAGENLERELGARGKAKAGMKRRAEKLIEDPKVTNFDATIEEFEIDIDGVSYVGNLLYDYTASWDPGQKGGLTDPSWDPYMEGLDIGRYDIRDLLAFDVETEEFVSIVPSPKFKQRILSEVCDKYSEDMDKIAEEDSEHDYSGPDGDDFDYDNY